MLSLCRFHGLAVDQRFVDFSSKLVFELIDERIELLLVLLGEVVGLEDPRVPLHLEKRLVWSDLWPMNRGHAGLFLK